MKIVSAACHEPIEPHLHVQQSGWCQLPNQKARVFCVRVDYHDPEKGIMEGVSIAVEEP